MSNTPNGNYYETKTQSWQSYDALPVRLKIIFMQAPYDFAATPTLKRWKAHNGDEASFRRDLIQRIFSVRDREIARAWGDDHPMIGQRPERYR